MNARKLIILATIAVITLALALWLGERRAPEANGGGTGQPLFPGLLDRVNEVDALEIQGAGGERLLRLERDGERWGLAERDGYPVQTARLRELLLNLARSSLLEAKTRNPDWYPRLGVEDVLDNPEAGGLLLTLELGGERKQLIIGNFDGQGGEGTFVRRPGEAGSWLASGNLRPDTAPAQWLERELADISAARIRSVRIEHPDGELLEVFKDGREEANFRIAGLPEGRSPSSEFVANPLASVLANLRLDDVQRFDAAGLDPAEAIRVTYSGFDGSIVELAGWRRDDQRWITLRARLDETAALEAIEAEQQRERERLAEQRAQHETQLAEAEAAGEPEAEGLEALREQLAAAIAAQGEFEAAQADERDRRLAALRNEIDLLNARAEGWAFAVPAFKFQNIERRLEDLLASPSQAE